MVSRRDWPKEIRTVQLANFRPSAAERTFRKRPGRRPPRPGMSEAHLKLVRSLLPELRARGHLLVVISHDDRYFHLADRIVRMEAGRMVLPQDGAQPVAAASASPASQGVLADI